MRLSLEPMQRQKISLECGLCKQLMDSEEQQETRVKVAIFGAVAYAVCPVCNQEVPKAKQTPEYCHKWNIRWGEHIIYECVEALKKARGM